MLKIQHIITKASEHNYVTFGSGPINLVIELGLGATIGEWYHIAKGLADRYSVLVYERNRNTVPARTPENIAKELYLLLETLGHTEKIILIAHSQGGLYAQQFARLYPHMITGIVLLDPLSARDNEYKTFFSPEEQKKSGFNKSENLVILEKLAKWHLGFIIRAVMRKAPPFYYYNDFSMEAKQYILSSISKPDIYASALEEYRLAHDEKYLKPLLDNEKFPNIPIVLITHTTDYSIRETMEFGQTDKAFAQKVETLWQDLMKDYLSLSSKSKFIQAKNSGHFIHLCEPEALNLGLEIFCTENDEQSSPK